MSFITSLGAADRDVLDLVLAGPEDDPAEQRGQRVVEVDVGAGYADQRLDAALDEVLAGLGQHRDRHVVGDLVALDELADEGEVGLAGAREADLDLLVAHPDQELEHRHLAGRAHRVDQRLVAVAEVGGEPARRPRDRRRWARCGRAGRSAGTARSARTASGWASAEGWSCGASLAGPGPGLGPVAHTHSAARGSGSGSDLAAATKEEATHHDAFTLPHRVAGMRSCSR